MLAAVLLLSSLVTLPLAYRYEQPLYEFVCEAEGVVRDNLCHLVGQESRPVVGGKINSGNVYHFGTRHLEFTLDRQPTKSLYLRGFSGGEYLGGDWTEANDRPLAAEVLLGLDFSFPDSPFYQLHEAAGEQTYTLTLDVTHTSGVYETDLPALPVLPADHFPPCNVSNEYRTF